MRKPVAVISLGGSLVAPHEPDIAYLKRFSTFIRRNKMWRFVVLVGGGWPARAWQQAARRLGVRDKDELDRLGVRATRLNAQLVRVMLGKLTEPVIATDPREFGRFKRRVQVAAGFKPGCSTDYRAVQAAQALGTEKILNLTNVAGIYDRDPKKYQNARALPELSWNEYLKIIGSKWTPGANMNFDPVASKLAKKLKFKVAVINGRDLASVQSALNGKPFAGTMIG